MYDELVKRLRDAAKMSDALAVLLPHSEGNATAKLYNDAADAIEELSRENESLAKSVNEASEILRKRWISATERLPERNIQVIVLSGIFVPFMEMAFYDGLWYSAWDGETEIEEVTHWMPLPQPPKEEA